MLQLQMTMKPEVRSPTLHDLNRIVDIDLKCFEFGYTVSQWRGLIIQTNSLMLVVEIQQEPVGFVLFSESGEIFKIAVKPKYQKQGLGTLLLTHTVVNRVKMGCNKLTFVLPETLYKLSSWLLRNKFKCVKLLRDQVAWCGKMEDGFLFEYTG